MIVPKVYLAFCFWMVFGALLEYATVSYAGKRIKLNLKRWEDFRRRVEVVKGELGNWSPPATVCGLRVSDIEVTARLVFPIIFVTFHSLYWTSLAYLTELHYTDLVPLHPAHTE